MNPEQARWFGENFANIVANVERVIMGKTEAVRLAVTCMLAEGHLLLEDYPGTGKTTLARAIAQSVQGTNSRIQFTPDLLPSDVTGVTIFDQKSGEFEFHQGPVFANIVLADEINRATPKSQSALLEAMEEFQVTVDGITHPLPDPFFVIATENPIEYEGTYQLPEAQVDRFLMRVGIGYPTPEQEVTILQRQVHEHPIATVRPAWSVQQTLQMQAAVRRVYIEPDTQRYIVDIVNRTRQHEAVALGASPRGSLAMMRCGQGVALLDGRDFVSPDDIKAIVAPALSHRIVIKPDYRMRGVTSAHVVEEILGSVAVPV